MPGYSQLKKLSEDVLSLGKEPAIRSERGEKASPANIPDSIPDIDDSDDFVLGMPTPKDDEKKDEDDEKNKVDLSDVSNISVEDILNDVKPKTESAENKSSNDALDLDGLLDLQGEDASESDLASFLESEDKTEKPVEEPTPVSDMSLDDLLKSTSTAEPEDLASSENVLDSEPLVEAEPIPDAEPLAEAESIPDAEPLAEPEAIPDVESLEDPEPIPEAENVSDAKDLSSDDLPLMDDDFDFAGDAIDLNADLPEDISEVPPTPKKETVPEEETEPFAAVDVPDIDFGSPMDSSETNESETDAASTDAPMPNETDDAFNEAAAVAAASSFANDTDFPSNENVPSDSDFPSDADFPSDENLPRDKDFPSDDFSVQDFDTKGMDDVDFGDTSGLDDNFAMPKDDGADFNIPDTDAKLSAENLGSTDFELSDNVSSDDFEIQGFTNLDADPFGKDGKLKIQEPDYSGAQSGTPREKNTLTDEEYKQFKKNLSSYPLNVRLAVEDTIVKNEFTDDAIFEVIEKILKKVPVRQLASHLEKMLDIQLSIPRDFERRTAAEYAAYKSSIQYQLRNKIIPGALIGLVAAMFAFCFIYLGNNFIYRPSQAQSLYKQGYTLLENNAYPQSEMKFNEALKFKSDKKWFYKYAEGYRAHKQYNRAENMYVQILRRFNHDKKAGIEYVKMELEDLAAYEKAEEILRREVLDYHTNDKDALLLLGDVFLEWGTEKDSLKLEDAKEQYSNLIQFYGHNDVYDSRLMRYYVRTDQLREVLQSKENFYPRKKALSSDDWTEMSGYLMDKLYGYIEPTKEYLRDSIVDVQKLLKIAVETGPTNPVATYNLARFYLHTDNHNDAERALKTSIVNFAKTNSMKLRDFYKYLDVHRLLGEEYMYKKEYNNSREVLTDGLKLFEDTKNASGIESDSHVGMMYADMADLDYFLYGDLDSALQNYESSLANKNDTPSINYRVGYIRYGQNDYDKALDSFLKASEKKNLDPNLMLSLANTFALRDDNFTAEGYYERLLERLKVEDALHGVVNPNAKPETASILENYLKATNNLGVTQYRLARRTGNSQLNGKSIASFTNSIVAWDRMTRNPETMIRLGGSNLAEQNLEYVTRPQKEYEPAIYTDIPRILSGEKGLPR